jgi:diguanylate cyclase (GGDEF)-like protein/PAS domain S-box-containing protein
MKRIRTLRSPLKLGLAPRLIALVVLVAIASGGLAGLVLTNTSRNALRDEILRNNLSHADLAAQFTSNYISAVEASVRSFASQPLTIAAIQADSPEQAQGDLVDWVGTQSALDGASFYDANGIQRVTASANKQTIGTSFADRDWFQGALSTRQPYFGVPVLSRVTGHPVASYAIPILDAQGRVRGIMTAGISLNTLSDAILKTLSATGSRASLIDMRNGGLTLADPDAARIMTPLTGNEAERRLLQGEHGAIETLGNAGEPDLAVYSPVPGLPWGVLVVQPRDTALAAMDTLSSQALLITALSILLAVLVGGSWTLKVTRPLFLLRNAALQLASGDLSHPVGFKQHDEIGDLGRAFDEMAGVLSEKQTQLATYAAKLEQSILDLQTEIAERRRAELALRENEQSQHSLFDNMQDGFIYCKLLFDDQDRPVDYLCLQANHAYERLIGVKDVVGNKASELMPWMKHSRPGLFESCARVAMSGQPEEFEFYFEPFDRWLSVSSYSYEKGFFASVFDDITKRKHAELALAEQRNLLRTVIDNLPDHIFVKDSNSIYILNNASQAEFVGKTIEDMLGKTDYDFFPPEIAEQFRATDRRVLESGQTLPDDEALSQDRFGNTRWALVTKVPLQDSQGRCIGIVGISRDITERKRVEEELAEQHHLLRILIDNLPDTIYVKDTASRMLIANTTQAHLLGAQRPEELLGKTDLDFFPKEFAQKYIADEQAIVASGQPQLAYEEIVVDKAGNPRWYLSTKVPFLDNQGKVKGIVGVGRDITERKRVETELVKFRLGIERADDAIFMTNLDGTIVYVNPAFEKTYGYTRDEAIGQTPRILKSGKLTQETYQHLWNTLLKKTSVVGEFVNKTKDGRLVNVEGSANPILDEKGSPVGFLAVQRDITQRKQAEENLLREVDKLNALHDVDRALSSTLDLPACLDIIVDRARSLFRTSSVALMLREGVRLRLVAQAGLERADLEVVIPLTSGLTGWCCSQRTSVLVTDVHGDERYMLYDARTQAEMAAPLLVQEECIGVLNVESDQLSAFSPADLELLESLAGRAATAIHNVRLLKAEREQRQFSETLRDFGLALTSQHDPDIVLDQLLNLVERVVPYDSASVVILEGNILSTKRQRGYEQFGAVDWLRTLDLPLEEVDNYRQMALTRQPQVVPDTFKDPNWVRVEGFRYVRSWVGAPIHVNGEVLGFLSLDKTEPGYYTAEMADRLAAFAAQASLALDNARLYAEQQKLAITDGLTGLFNRRHFMELAEREYRSARRHKTALSVLMIDMDNFKQVNDRYGHAVGDLALQVAAKAMSSTVRAIDVVARYGGDEFVVLLPGCDGVAAHVIAERLREGIKGWTVATKEGSIRLSLSIGTAVLDGDEDLDYLLARADADMYCAKGMLKMAAAQSGA